MLSLQCVSCFSYTAKSLNGLTKKSTALKTEQNITHQWCIFLDDIIALEKQYVYILSDRDKPLCNFETLLLNQPAEASFI